MQDVLKEYWVNVYKYPNWKIYLYSNPIKTQSEAERLGSYKHAVMLAHASGAKRPRKCIYRIHVKMKPLYVQQAGRFDRIKND